GDLPHVLDPRRGFVASANNEMVPLGFSPSLSRDYLSPYRIHEIVTRLSYAGRESPQAIGAIQADSFDYPGFVLARAAAPILSGSSNQGDRALGAMLAAWNGDASVDAQAPTFMSVFEAALERRILGPLVGNEMITRYDKEHHFVTPIVRVLAGDRSLEPLRITRDRVLASILPAAHVAEAELGYPAKPLAAWGEHNAAIYDHPLGVGWPLSLMNAPRIAQPGDPFAPFQSKPDFGPSMRLVADLKDWDDSSMLLTLGESGIWTDAHYDDQERDWAAVAWAPTPFSDAAVQRDAQHTLRLEPATGGTR
ncbi:MAG TPA: penicillin acylase family protein, partial [Candidatus Eremiobacteraceae bacterium]|nr:penicillin acylase family protein [Candidatus Eremiobacteraceae bacterium]